MLGNVSDKSLSLDYEILLTGLAWYIGLRVGITHLSILGVVAFLCFISLLSIFPDFFLLFSCQFFLYFRFSSRFLKKHFSIYPNMEIISMTRASSYSSKTFFHLMIYYYSSQYSLYFFRFYQHFIYHDFVTSHYICIIIFIITITVISINFRIIIVIVLINVVIIR